MSRPLSQRVVASTVVLVTGLAIPVRAQQPKPAFEVASVKRSHSAQPNWSQTFQPGGRYVATNAPLVNLIQFAYGVPDYRLDDVPGWVRTERFDVTAKAETDVPAEQIGLMLRTLLETRFRLKIRREDRDMAVRTLVLARSDGRVGPNLEKVSKPDGCEAAMATPRDVPSAAVQSRGCNSMSTVAGLVGRHMNAPVVDGTGLTGLFAYWMYYEPDLQTASDANLPSFVTALSEQLGLRVQSGRGSVEVIVIESVERPTEN